jgi:hypothetical protein
MSGLIGVSLFLTSPSLFFFSLFLTITGNPQLFQFVLPTIA